MSPDWPGALIQRLSSQAPTSTTMRTEAPTSGV